MGRISERISEAMSTVECPGCGKRVVPTPAAPPDASAQPSAPPAEGDQRWSFIWRPPSGQVCPECFFPLARFARRLKWVRTFSAGLVILVIALMLFVLWLLNPASDWPVQAARLVAAVGAVVLLVGVVGIVVGGRRKPGDEPTR
jgi:hypothetical protein